MRLFASILSFEMWQQLRGHVFWIVFGMSLVMVAGALWVPELRVGISGSLEPSETIVRTQLLWSLFYMFTAAAFAADAALRDDITGLAPIIRSTAAPRSSLMLGRFVASFGATTICFLSVPMALLLLYLEPDSMTDGPQAFAAGFFLLSVPNLFTSTVFFFVLATLLRSMLGTLVGATALLILYGLGIEPGGDWRWALVEPFGFAALESGFQLLFWNRLLWMTLGGVALVALLFLPEREARRAPSKAKDFVDTRREPIRLELPQPSFGMTTTMRQFAARARFELRQILFSPAFVVLLMLGLGNAAATLWRLLSAQPLAGDDQIVAALIDAFDLVPIVVAIFYAGELVRNEQDHRVQELIGAAPLPNSALLLPKLFALALALLGLALSSAGAALSIPSLFGRAGPSLVEITGWYVLPRSFDWLLIGVLSLFFQALAPNKLAGWGLIVLYLIVSLALEQTGYRDPIYRYGSYPGHPLPAALTGAEKVDLHRFYWAAFALLLVVLANAVLHRGEVDGFRARLLTGARVLRGISGLLAAGALLLFALTGMVLWGH